MERNAAELIFLQETHIAQDSNTKLYSMNITVWYYGDSLSRRSKGVVIGFGKNFSFVLEERKVDPEGSFLFLRGTLQGMKYTLANVYCLNKYPQKYLIGILNELMEFKQGYVILAGDFNFSMDHKLDSTSGALDKYEHQLVDVWRIQHPSTKDYTYYSAVHDTYSRLDYISVEHRSLEIVVKTLIGIKTISDHAPVIMKMKLKWEVMR